MAIKAYLVVLPLLCLAQTSFGLKTANRILWYSKPARNWEKEALPLGNGSLGCMVYGGVEKEHIQFNHDTLWVGSEKDTGCYQNFGDIYIELAHTQATDYRRELDVSRAVQTITYKVNGVCYKREYFSSRPANVMVFRYMADKEKALTGKITLVDAHGATTTAKNNRITACGDLKDHQMYRKKSWKNPIVLNFESQLIVLNQGGTLETNGNAVSFRNCDSLTILVVAGTDYINQRNKGWKREHPHKRVTASIDAAAQRPYEELLEEHIKDYQSLYHRLTINLGTTDEKILRLPMDARLAACRGGRAAPKSKMNYEAAAVGGSRTPDPALEELLFQYARYLMISCSRPGCMPSNLQGLWNESNNPPWRCDYHSDVNTQMHYWFVDQANLSDCFSPLSEWFFSVREVRREETMAHFKKRGIAMHAENGVFGGSTWKWSVGDASWLANNLMDHYRYTLDKEYLEKRAYPIMNDLFMFWEDHLKQIPAPGGNGTVLVSPDGFSPEHGPHEDGVSFDQQLAWDLLSNFSEASEILCVNEKERKKALIMRDSLLAPQVGSWGQLQEWMVDRDQPDNKHRHLSHLIAVHPGRQISPLTTPRLTEAAKVSMNARGDGATGWSKAWKINIWARLHDGNRAYKLLREMIQGNVYDNLLDAHPPFQIDGNFGYASGVCEMLIQSHMGQIHLLPALPQAWPNGEIMGIRARGGFEVDMKWNEGELTQAVILSDKGSDCMLRTEKPVTVKQGGKKVNVEKIENGVVSFPTESGKQYHIEPTAK
jgi:alpha-L-fucosidase 2